jgi:hypothetical protein
MLEGKNPEPLYLNVNPDAQFWLREDSYFSTRLLTSRSEGGISDVHSAPSKQGKIAGRGDTSLRSLTSMDSRPSELVDAQRREIFPILDARNSETSRLWETTLNPFCIRTLKLNWKLNAIHAPPPMSTAPRAFAFHTRPRNL